MSTNRYINLIKACLQAVRSSRIPLYSCKYSRRTYTQHQLLAILLFREVLGTDYRDTVALLDLMDRIKALAEGILKGYQDLFKLYPDAYSKDGELIDYFSTRTRAGQVTVQRMVKTFKALCEMADFNGVTQQGTTFEGNASLTAPETLTNVSPVKTEGLGENITLNINIQITLPECKDIEIHDNIFSSMRKHIFPKGAE